MDISFRGYLDTDIEFLKRSVGGCWGSSFFVGDDVLDDDISLNFLSMFLEESNCSRVAVIEGVPVGFIFGHLFSEPLWSGWSSAHKDKMESAKRLGNDKRCRDYLEYYGAVFEIYRRAVKDSGKDYDSEIVLLTVNPRYHGLGVGKALLKEMETTFKEKGASDTFLFTSGFSDHDFYKHVGFELVFDTYMEMGHFGPVGVYIYARSF